MFVNNEHRITYSGVIPMSLSDHSFIYCIVKAGVPKGKPRTIEYRCYKSYDKEANAKSIQQPISNDTHHHHGIFLNSRIVLHVCARGLQPNPERSVKADLDCFKQQQLRATNKLCKCVDSFWGLLQPLMNLLENFRRSFFPSLLGSAWIQLRILLAESLYGM